MSLPFYVLKLSKPYTGLACFKELSISGMGLGCNLSLSHLSINSALVTLLVLNKCLDGLNLRVSILQKVLKRIKCRIARNIYKYYA